MKLSMRSWILGFFLALAVAAPAFPAQTPYSGVVVFGTSLSDPGNAFALRGINNVPPEYLFSSILVPSAPYAQGGHHLSNGAPWIVQFARPLGLAPSVQAAFRDDSDKATNYAVDGARARDDGINVNLSDQVGRFFTDVGGIAPSDALYVLELGSNDVFDAFKTYLLGGNGAPVLQAAATALAMRLSQLYAAGARHFLIANIPDVALTPAIRIVDAEFPGMGVPQLATSLVQTFNAALVGIAGQLPPDADVHWLDIYGKLNEIVADPPAFGLTNIADPCVTPNVPPFTCQRPDQYLFWDGIHPTKAVHAIFAQAAADTLLH